MLVLDEAGVDVLGHGEAYAFDASAALEGERHAGDAVRDEPGYATYHQYLATKLIQTGGEPDPADYRDDLAGYTAASDAIMDILTAEVLLRRCRNNRQFGLPLNAPLAPIPIIDGSYRLVSVLSPPAADDMQPMMPWFPLPPPDPAALTAAARAT